MPLAAADLSNNIAALKQLVLAQAADIERIGAELTAAKAGLVTKTLEIEKLKVEIGAAKTDELRRASSERMHRELEQLELKLEKLETAEAEAEAAAETNGMPDVLTMRIGLYFRLIFVQAGTLSWRSISGTFVLCRHKAWKSVC